MKTTRPIIFLLAFLILISLVTAQDFRGTKWGMSKQQIIDKEKEGMPIDAMLDNGLSFRYTSNAKSLYTSLDATYIFSDGKNGLEAIFLVYNDASLKLFHNI